jgi:hypothetical protein
MRRCGWGRVFDLVNPSKIKRAFDKEVVADLPKVVERRVEEAIDWMVSSDIRQWQGVTDLLEKRRLQHSGPHRGPGGRRVRARSGPPAGGGAPRVAASGRSLRPRRGVEPDGGIGPGGGRRTAALQVGALGLGTIVTMLATTAMGDITGLLAAGALSVIGLLVLPAQRGTAKNELRTKVEVMRRRLMEALTAQFDHELTHSLARIREAVSPYTRFVRSERER